MSEDSRTLKKKIFKNKNVDNLLEEIYSSISNEHDEIKSLMNEITSLLLDGEEGNEGLLGFIGPVLSDLLDVSVKNNEQYIKLAEVVQKFLKLDIKEQRIIADKTGNVDSDAISLSEADKKKLHQIKTKMSSIKEETSKIQQDIDMKNA